MPLVNPATDGMMFCEAILTTDRIAETNALQLCRTHRTNEKTLIPRQKTLISQQTYIKIAKNTMSRLGERYDCGLVIMQKRIKGRSEENV